VRLVVGPWALYRWFRILFVGSQGFEGVLVGGDVARGRVVCGRGAADPIPFHASRRACAFYSLSLRFAAWWSPQGSNDMAARARPLRVQPSRSEYQRARRAQVGGAEVSAERHKSDCRSTAGEDQEGLRLCGLEGRRSMQRCRAGYGCLAGAMPTRRCAAGCS
jgi:hypothetical protein